MREIFQSSNISVVVDNNILIDLFELRRLDLLFKVFVNVVIPEKIYNEEVSQDIIECLQQHTYILGNFLTERGLNTLSILMNDDKFKRLSDNDKYAIAFASENYYFCNSNDKPVRNACEALNIKHTGTLGVLGRAYYQSLLTKDELFSLLDQLISDSTTCYISLKMVEQFKLEIL